MVGKTAVAASVARAAVGLGACAMISGGEWDGAKMYVASDTPIPGFAFP